MKHRTHIRLDLDPTAWRRDCWGDHRDPSRRDKKRFTFAQTLMVLGLAMLVIGARWPL